MITVDPLYGVIEIPTWLDKIILTPEVQRLREVRLINTSTPYFPALSDTRRFTHALGVLHLALRLAPALEKDFSSEQMKAFLVSAVVHDVGTPAFGHVFEYLLEASTGWTHEGALLSIFNGLYRPDGPYHQIYYGNALHLASVLRSSGVNPDLVASYVSGQSPVGQLIAGTIDLDNIDNVFRMAFLLGLAPPDLRQPEDLVDGLTPTSDGPVFSPSAEPLIIAWKRLRRIVYEVLAFDESNLIGQTMLTDSLVAAMENGRIGEEHWFYTDEQLLQYLAREPEPEIYRPIQRFATGDYYSTIFVGWYDVPKGDTDLRLPSARQDLKEALEQRLKVPCSPYVFYDRGTFEKNLQLRFWQDAESSANVEIWTLGRQSLSTLVGVFSYRRLETASKKLIRAAEEVLADYGLSAVHLRPIPEKRTAYELPGQTKLPL
jgi:HD superfamily phosphohydrolase